MTPRSGAIGGRPVGQSKAVDPRAHRDTQEGLRLEARSEDIMAAAGYNVERRPVLQPGERVEPWLEMLLSPDTLDPGCRIGSKQNPDDRIGGNIFDMVAPKSSNPDQVRRALERKIEKRQAYRLVLNLGRTEVTRGQVEALLRRKPVEGLQELFIIEKDTEALFRVLPSPEQITSAPQGR